MQSLDARATYVMNYPTPFAEFNFSCLVVKREFHIAVRPAMAKGQTKLKRAVVKFVTASHVNSKFVIQVR